MTQCSCDLIPLYIGSLFFGILIALMASPNNAVSDSFEYLMNGYENFVYDGIHNPSGIPNALLSSPVFYGIVVIVGYWKKYYVMIIPRTILFRIKNMTVKSKVEQMK